MQIQKRVLTMLLIVGAQSGRGVETGTHSRINLAKLIKTGGVPNTYNGSECRADIAEAVKRNLLSTHLRSEITVDDNHYTKAPLAY
jgi:hypothetical protein